MKVIFTNGCFDIIHRAHIELFKYCKTVGDHVVVGLNSDKSVSRIKGNGRPINSQEDRKEILNSLSFVDDVIIFNEDTPYKLIKMINPDIIVKGGDYHADSVVGNDLCEVRIFNYLSEYSTTKIINRIKDA